MFPCSLESWRNWWLISLRSPGLRRDRWCVPVKTEAVKAEESGVCCQVRSRKSTCSRRAEFAYVCVFLLCSAQVLPLNCADSCLLIHIHLSPETPADTSVFYITVNLAKLLIKINHHRVGRRNNSGLIADISPLALTKPLNTSSAFQRSQVLDDTG